MIRPKTPVISHESTPMLWYREDRDIWCICWYLPRTRRVKRTSTGVKGGAPGRPPQAALDALQQHVDRLAKRVPEQAEAVWVSFLLAEWLIRHVVKLARAEPYGYSVLSLERFFANQQAVGWLKGECVVADLDSDLIDRFIEFRFAEGVGGHTVDGDLCALRGCLRWAKAYNYLQNDPPRIRYVDPKRKNKSKTVEYSIEEVARLLEAAARLPERAHVLLFIIIMLSTHCRVEALLELTRRQIINNNFIDFLGLSRHQTEKRRCKMKICPSLHPWLEDVGPKVIQYRPTKSKPVEGSVAGFTRPTFSIKTAFKACLIEAGITDGYYPDKPSKPKGGPHSSRHPAKRRPRPRGGPNSLRHTTATYLNARGVPEAQIQHAAGHVTEEGSGEKYVHLRPEYLREFIAAIELFWCEVDVFTSVHRRQAPARDIDVRPTAAALPPRVDGAVTIIAFEGSSMERDGVPIEVGVCMWRNRSAPLERWSSLIQPTPEWKADCSWSDVAAQKHRIQRRDLSFAMNVSDVASRLWQLLGMGAGGALCSFDAASDTRYSEQLFAAAQLVGAPFIGDFSKTLASQLDDGRYGQLMRRLATSKAVRRVGDNSVELMRAYANALGYDPAVVKLVL